MYKNGEIVYLITGDDYPRIVTGILKREKATQYELSQGSDTPTWHYGFELTREKPNSKTIKGLRK